MNRAELRVLYDEQMRRRAWVPGLPLEALPEVSRYIDPLGREGLLMWSSLSTANADAVIAREIAHFSARLASFEWKLYDGDSPADLRLRLLGFGFQPDEPNALMVLPLAEAGTLLARTSALEIRRLARAEEVDDLDAVWQQVWPEESGDWAEVLRESLGREPAERDPGGLGIHVAYSQDVPVAAAYVVTSTGCDFAYLGGGATIAAWRRHGLYGDLLAARAREAARQGSRYLCVEAGPMSRPHLQKHGFFAIGDVEFLTWQRP